MSFPLNSPVLWSFVCFSESVGDLAAITVKWLLWGLDIELLLNGGPISFDNDTDSSVILALVI